MLYLFQIIEGAYMLKHQNDSHKIYILKMRIRLELEASIIL